MRRLCVALILLAAVGCGGSSSPPVSPSPSTASPIALTDFSGLWTGTYTFTTCTGERHCDLRIGTSQDFGLRLEQAGSGVHGLFTWSDFAAEISGDVRDDGSVTLSGEAPKASEKDWGMTVSRIALRLSPERALQGTIAYQTHPGLNLAEFAGSMAAEGQIGSTRREDLRAFVATVDGTWNGRFAIRGCTPPGGAPFCNPHEDQETAAVELSLLRSGDALTGTFVDGTRRVPVTGRILGNSISLSGETDAPESGSTTRVRIAGFDGTIDSLGRLNGKFVYEFLSPSAAPTFGETANAEMWQVVRVR